jgi:hypothetical protein
MDRSTERNHFVTNVTLQKPTNCAPLPHAFQATRWFARPIY